MVVETGPLALDETRAALAAEWAANPPTTPDAIHRFYRTSERLGDDLEAWHQTPERKSWTDMLVHVARESEAQRVVDIGCGGGHDLAALRQALPSAALFGVEPNAALRDAGQASAAATIVPDIAQAPLEMADLLVCVDVLEHVPDPEAFIAGIAQRAPVGCLLFETCPTHDHSTPLHLESNRGWHPGHVLEAYGWRIVDEVQNRVRVWKRLDTVGRQTASLLLCSYRDVTTGTMQAIMRTVNDSRGHWRCQIKNGDADIGRSRAIIVTKWYQETADDVFLMIDSDLTWKPEDADHVVELCRNGYDIVAGAYPVHNGEHLSLRCLPGTDSVEFGPGKPPQEIQYAATGFMAVHRRVIEAMVRTVPLCHAFEAWAFYPLFQQPVVEDEHVGGWARLSEDWGFCEMARDLGFKVWVDPTVILGHQSTFPVTVRNMGLIFEASQKV